MSMTKDRGLIIFQCDECKETLETETKEFAEAVTAQQEAGWFYRRYGNEHLHFHTLRCLNSFYMQHRTKSKS